LENGSADLEILSDFSNETLEGEFTNKEFGGFLVAADLAEGDCAGAEAMGFLYTTGCGLLVGG
jgi:hypothetical protein